MASGSVRQVIGTVIDVEFPSGDLPEIFNAVEIDYRLTLTGPECAPGGMLGDTNCDGAIDALDIEPFLVALFDPGSYPRQYPNCDINNADINGDGSISALDIEPFLDLLF